MFARRGVTPSAAVAGPQASVAHSARVVHRQLFVSPVQVPSEGGSPPVEGSRSEQQGEVGGHWLLVVHASAQVEAAPLVTQIWFVPQHAVPQACAAGQQSHGLYPVPVLSQVIPPVTGASSPQPQI